MRYRRDRSAGVIVFRRAEGRCRFLLILSRQTKRPLWEFPKGGVDADETPLEAALRELEEETGLSRAMIRLVDGFETREEYRFTIGTGADRTLVRKEVTYYLAEALTDAVRLAAKEARSYAWLEQDEARQRLRYAARRRMLDGAARAAGCTAPARAQSEMASRKRHARRRSGRAKA